MVATSYEYDLRMCVSEKYQAGFEKFSIQMRELIRGALKEGELSLAADYHLFLQMQERDFSEKGLSKKISA